MNSSHIDPFETPRSSQGGGDSPARMRPQRIAQTLYDAVQQDAAHQQVKKRAAALSSDSLQSQQQPRTSNRPNFLVCYLCGQQFSKTSLGIHQPQCYVKKLIEWERTTDVRRGPQPLHPDAMREKLEAAGDGVPMLAHGPDGIKGVEKFNEAQFRYFNDEMLLACEHCGRTFLPDRLAVHQRSCKPGHAAKPPLQKRTGGTPPPQSPLESGSASHGGSDNSTPSTAPFPGAVLLADEAMSPQLTAHDISDESCVPRSTSPPVVQQQQQQPTKKIPLNNVSNFKHVPSRLRQALEHPEESFLRCQYCNRTFAPTRLERHEEVCLDRKEKEKQMALLNHSGGGGGVVAHQVALRTKLTSPVPNLQPATTRPPSSSNAQQRQRTSVSPAGLGCELRHGDDPPMYSSPTMPMGSSSGGGCYVPFRASKSPRSGASVARHSPVVDVCHSLEDMQRVSPLPPTTPSSTAVPKFCTECGHKLYTSAQKFCGECGTRVISVLV